MAQHPTGGTTAGSIAVQERDVPLAGPGTGRWVSAPDARPRAVVSREPGDFPMPTGREEEWRFTPVDRLSAVLSGERPESGELSAECTAPEGVEVRRIAAGDPAVGSVALPADRAAAVALSRTPEVLHVRVTAGAAPEPVVVRVQGQDAVAYRHLVVTVDAGATGVVVLDHAGSAELAAGVECAVGDGASLTLVSVQDWDPGSVHLGQHAARLGADAHLRMVHVTFGGDLVRLSPRVSYTAPGGSAELFGVYFADASQHLEHRTLVDHQAPRCRSRVSYRGALQGEGAHTVWVGDVVIGPGAVGTDTYESNRNLLLTDGTRADSVPNLEILTGEVAQAGHASTTGRFDDEQLFYLQSRGIPEDEARRLVVRAFFAEVIDQIAVPELQQRVTAAVEAELSRTRP